MALIEHLLALPGMKFSFAKSSEYHVSFSREVGAASMYQDDLGLGIPAGFSTENKLRAVFTIIAQANGYFIFNINGVDLKRAATGFGSYDEAEDNNMITEWELSMLLQNQDYLEKTIFHNGKNLFDQTDGGLQITWN